MSLKTIVSGLSIFLAQAASAGVVLHSTATTDTGFRSDFDRATMLFAAQTADTLTLSNFGSGIFHDHSSADYARVQLEVFNGTNWINIFTSADVGNSNVALGSIFVAPITFTEMTVSGLRLSSTAFVNQAFHYVSDSMTYTLTDNPAIPNTANVPEPTSVALIALGLLAAAAARKRQA